MEEKTGVEVVSEARSRKQRPFCTRLPCRRQEFRAIGLRQPIAIVGNVVNLPSGKNREILASDRRARRFFFFRGLHPKKGIHDLLEGMGTPASRRLAPENWSEEGESEHREEVGREIEKRP